MATREAYNLSCGSLPLSMDVIDLTVESPVHRSSQTSSRSTIRSQSHLESKPEFFVLNENVSGPLDATVAVTTRVTPSNNSRVVRNNAKVRSTFTASNKNRSGSKTRCKNKAKPNETINLDDTVLPEPSSPLHTNDTTTLICAICLEELLSRRKPTATRCGHIFCEECLNRAMKKLKQCPQCRTCITKRSCIRLHF